MGRILNVAAIVALLLVLARPAWATLGMCTITGTVYNVDGSVAKFGDVNFRLPSTQTFSADSVQTSLEAVKLDSGGNIPAGTQVPLGARIFIQVNNDKPVSVVVTNNPLNCPLAFGTLYGSSAGGVPIPSTVITSISTINNIPGITDTAVNPPGAGPATLTLNDQLPTTFGSTTQQPDLSGTSYGGLLSIFSNLSFGPSLQLVNPATGAGDQLGQISWGSPNTTDAEQRDAVIQVINPSSVATHANGQMNFFLANGSGTSLGTLGPIFSLVGPTTTGNGPYTAQVNSLGTGSNTQAYFQAQASGAFLFAGQRSSTYSLGDVPAGYGFLEEGGGNGLYIVSDSVTGDEGIHFAANSQIANGNLQLTEDAAGNFFWQLPGVNIFFRNANNSMNVEADNTYNTAGATSQAGFFVANSNGIEGGFSAIGNSSTGFGAPYFANTTYVNSDGGTLLLYSGGGNLRLAASAQGAAGTLEMSEDASNDFQFEPTNANGFVRFFGGGTTQPALIAESTGNNSQDYFQVLPQNLTQGIGMSFNEIREIGSNGGNSLQIDAQSGGGRINLNAVAPASTWTGSFSSIGTVNNHHLFASVDGGTAPASGGSCGTATGLVVSGSDNSGQVTLTGGSISTSCLINFGTAWTNAPNCTCSTVNANGVATACGTNTSTTQMNLWTQVNGGTATLTTQIHWVCIGISDGPLG